MAQFRERAERAPASLWQTRNARGAQNGPRHAHLATRFTLGGCRRTGAPRAFQTLLILATPSRDRTPRAFGGTRESRMSMFTHVTVGTNDIAKARKFYDAILKPLGYSRTADLGD